MDTLNVDDNFRYPEGKYKGIRIGMIPEPILRAEISFGKVLRKRKHAALRNYLKEKLYGKPEGEPAKTNP